MTSPQIMTAIQKHLGEAYETGNLQDACNAILSVILEQAGTQIVLEALHAFCDETAAIAAGGLSTTDQSAEEYWKQLSGAVEDLKKRENELQRNFL